MLQLPFKLERPLFFFDLETTARKPEEARIIELGFWEFGPAGFVREWCGRFNPEVPIPPKVSEITGISDFDVSAKPRFRQIAANLAKGFSNCDFAGNNIRYDLRVMSAEMGRAGQEWSYAGARILCNYRLEQIAVPRKLADLYERYTGKKLEGAHGALVDTRASTEVLIGQLARWAPLFPADLQQLHDLQWPDWIDTEGKFRFDEQGIAYMNFGKHQDLPLEKVPRDYWDFMLSPKEKFSAEAKAIAAAAKLGNFPRRQPLPEPIEERPE